MQPSPYEPLQNARRHLLGAYSGPAPALGQCPECPPMLGRDDMACGANRTYTAKPVGVDEP